MKNLIQTLKIRLAKRFHKVGLIYWAYWSRLYRFLFHWKYEKIPLAENLSVVQVDQKLSRLIWIPDGPRELWDACGSPHRIQHVLNAIDAGNPQPNEPLDCDDFSIWACNAIDRKYYPRIFSFAWVTQDGEIKGHAMCLCRQKNGKLFHLGNWGLKGPYKNLREACQDILKLRDAREGVCWALYDRNLNLLISGPELPSGKIC